LQNERVLNKAQVQKKKFLQTNSVGEQISGNKKILNTNLKISTQSIDDRNYTHKIIILSLQNNNFFVH